MPETLDYDKHITHILDLVAPQIEAAVDGGRVSKGAPQTAVLGYALGVASSICEARERRHDAIPMTLLALHQLWPGATGMAGIQGELRALERAGDRDFARAFNGGWHDQEAMEEVERQPNGLLSLVGINNGLHPPPHLPPTRSPTIEDPGGVKNFWRAVRPAMRLIGEQLEKAGLASALAWGDMRQDIVQYAIGLTEGLIDMLESGASRRLASICVLERLDPYASFDILNTDLEDMDGATRESVGYRSGYRDAASVYAKEPLKWLWSELRLVA